MFWLVQLLVPICVCSAPRDHCMDNIPLSNQQGQQER